MTYMNKRFGPQLASMSTHWM